MQMNKKVVIVGAGISGLTCAYWLKKHGFDIMILEKDYQVGGTMQTIQEDGYLIEKGPNSALETTPLFNEIFQDLEIIEQRVYANEASNKRYILRNSTLHPIPMSPPAFIKSKLWSTKGKLRILKEPFIGKSIKEESVAEFVERRLGKEILDYAINPFVAGVFAGNPEELSVKYAFPKLYALEEKYGGLIKGLIKGRKERKQRAEKAKDRARMFSFVNGMYTLPDAIFQKLKNNFQLNSKVENIIPYRSDKSTKYVVNYYRNGEKKVIETDIVILSVPAYAAAKIINPIDPETSRFLEKIYYPPVAEVFLGYKNEIIQRNLDGFGYLIPEKEKRKILGTIWSSTIFPNRAPEGFSAFTTFVGGSRNPEIFELDDIKLLEVTNSELKNIIGIKKDPEFLKVIRWEKAIPQYNLGYGNVLNVIEKFERNYNGVFICANYRGGISVGDCIISSDKTVKRILNSNLST